jgi:hypothetical protein
MLKESATAKAAALSAASAQLAEFHLMIRAFVALGSLVEL